MRVLPFDYSDQHYATMVEIINSYYPMFPTHVNELLTEDYNEQHKERHRFLYESEEAIAGFGDLHQTSWTDDRHHYTIEIFVRQDRQGQGLGTRIFDHLMGIQLATEMHHLESSTSTQIVGGSRFLEKRRFRLATREHVSALDLTHWSPKAIQTAYHRFSPPDIQMVSYADLSNTGHSLRDLYDLVSTLDRDIPWHAPHNPESFAQYQHRRKADDRIQAKCSFVAMTPDQKLIGATELETRPNAPSSLYQGLTGVLPKFRRKGIAQALKTMSFNAVQDRLPHIHNIWTENEENNAMYLLNKKLGFIQKFDWLFYQKE